MFQHLRSPGCHIHERQRQQRSPAERTHTLAAELGRSRAHKSMSPSVIHDYATNAAFHNVDKDGHQRPLAVTIVLVQ